MSRRRTSRCAMAGAATTLAVMLLSGCGAAVHAPRTPAPTPSSTAGPSPAAIPAPTCAGILSPATVHALTKTGWTARQDPFYIGNTRMAGGIQCTWGDPRHPTDDVQVYGWAPTTAARTAAAAKELTATGWRKVTDDQDTCYTAAGDMITGADSDGFGMTYCFTADHVTVADTRQGLLLVQWPPAP